MLASPGSAGEHGCFSSPVLRMVRHMNITGRMKELGSVVAGEGRVALALCSAVLISLALTA